MGEGAGRTPRAASEKVASPGETVTNPRRQANAWIAERLAMGHPTRVWIRQICRL